MSMLIRSQGLLAVFLLAAGSVSAGELRIAILETRDPYCKVLGLSELLAAEGVAFNDAGEEFGRGAAPVLAETDLLIVGSFATADERIAKAYRDASAELRRFVAEGGVVAVLGQADQDHANEAWLQSPRRLVRDDPDATRAFVHRSGHPLLTAREPVTAADLRGWRVPTDWRSENTIWEAFSEWDEAAVILGGSESESSPGAGLIEMGWGKGRAVFYAMAPDKAFVAGNDAAKAGGTKLLRNLLAYAALVEEGRAPAVVPTAVPGYKHPIRGTVYVDANGNGRRDDSEPGRAGVAVGNGFEVEMTDASGSYRLPNADGKSTFAILHQPGDVKQNGQAFFHRLRDDAGPEERFDFGLVPADAGAGGKADAARFVQLTDSHVRNVSDQEYMRQATDEIYAMQPPADFVVATGDLVDRGIEEHYQNYVAGMQKPPVPYFNVFGNHEIAGGPIDRYHFFVGPDYYSFERGGVLFLALNCVTPGPRQDAWLKRTLELLGKGRPVVAFQHFPPTPEEMERFAGLGVKSVFSGHWHSEKEVEHAGVQSVNSPTFIMGGIDASPAGFKVVRLSRDGSADTEWRYGFQDKRLTVVSPQRGVPVSGVAFPLIVNAYDTSVEVDSVTWRLGPGGNPVASGALNRDSAVGWSGSSKSAVPDGSHSLVVEARDKRGEIWTVRQEVQAISAMAATPAVGREWPMFMGSSGHGGFNPEPLGKLPLRLAWAVDTGGDPDFASPILAGGRLYLALKKRTGGRTNGVAAFDPATGERLWLFETPTAVNHTPAFADGVLCVAEMGGRIHGLDAATGKGLWHHDLIDDRGRFSYCAPVAHGGAFYAGVMRRLAKLRAADGHLHWETQVSRSDTDWISSYGSPAVGDGTLVMSGQTGDSVVAVRTEDGSRLWNAGGVGGMLASATVVGDRVLVCARDSTLRCRRLGDGEEVWNRQIGARDENANWSATTPAVKPDERGQGVIVAGSGNGHMSGVRLSDGELLWTHDSGPAVFKVSPYRRDDRPLLSSPTIAGDKVLFGSADGKLYCLDAASGSGLWSFTFGVPVLSTPLVSGNAVYVAAYDGRLYCFTSEAGGSASASPSR